MQTPAVRKSKGWGGGLVRGERKAMFKSSFVGLQWREEENKAKHPTSLRRFFDLPHVCFPLCFVSHDGHVIGEEGGKRGWGLAFICDYMTVCVCERTCVHRAWSISLLNMEGAICYPAEAALLFIDIFQLIIYSPKEWLTLQAPSLSCHPAGFNVDTPSTDTFI